MSDSLVETLKKILTTGVGAALLTEESLRGVLSESHLTRQAKDYLIRQASKGRNELTKMLMGEFKRFLEHIDLHSEIQKAIAGMKVDIRATITLSPQQKLRSKNKLMVKKIKIRR